MEEIYYTTQTGNLGVSLDGGKTLFNHMGRRMPVNTAWDESCADWEDLSIECRTMAGKLVENEDEKADTILAVTEEKLRVETDKKERIAEKNRIAKEQREAFLASPKGKDWQRLQIEKDRALMKVIFNYLGIK